MGFHFRRPFPRSFSILFHSQMHAKPSIKRYYRLFEYPIDASPSTPSAHRIHVRLGISFSSCSNINGITITMHVYFRTLCLVCLVDSLTLTVTDSSDSVSAPRCLCWIGLLSYFCMLRIPQPLHHPCNGSLLQMRRLSVSRILAAAAQQNFCRGV